MEVSSPFVFSFLLPVSLTELFAQESREANYHKYLWQAPSITSLLLCQGVGTHEIWHFGAIKLLLVWKCCQLGFFLYNSSIDFTFK